MMGDECGWLDCDRRYAAGELDLETYQAMRATLASGRSNGHGGGQ